MRGWVYVLSNKAMPGLLKIGFTLKDPTLRARELEKTGVPHPFDLDYEVLVKDPRLLEQKVHLRLAHARERKEWFRCELAEAVKAIQDLVGGNALVENCFGEVERSEPDLPCAEPPSQPEDLHRPGIVDSMLGSAQVIGPAPVSIRFAAPYLGPCQYCGVPIKVTVTRHESGTVCPWCHRYNDLTVFVRQELPR